jgi:hypothetical protein
VSSLWGAALRAPRYGPRRYGARRVVAPASSLAGIAPCV